MRPSFILLPTLAGFSIAADCAADNCLRALRATQTPGQLQAAQSFCATYTTQLVQATAIPSFAVDACKQNQNGNLAERLSSACACLPAATTTSAGNGTATPTPTGGACALVSASSAAQRAATPSATPTVAASLAHECLSSVPLGKEAALKLVDAMAPYLEWQSDAAWKKDPPSDYFYPPHDIFGYLASVKANLQADKYANEYEFQQDLYNVFAKGHDGHFIFYPDALTKAFEWGRKRSLVSISKDGSEIPEIYLYEDITSAPSTASPVTEINGEDAATYVANFAYTASFNQDADAAYNSMFYEKAYVAAGNFKGYFSSGGRTRYIYPGPNTTFTFNNGTTLALENIANVKGNFGGVVDGPSFYKKFCTGPTPTAAADVVATTAATGVPGYPAPVIVTNDSIVSGYYLDGADYEDVAVLSLLAMESESPLEFQQVVQKFLADAVAAGKTKLVIDLSANGGGYILQGYDLFRQLFPDIVQDGFSHWRENDQLLAISKIFSDSIPANYNPQTANDATISLYENYFNYRYDYNLTNQAFPTYEAKFGPPPPNVFKGDAFTAISRWNLDDPLTTINDTYGMGMDITGYGARKNFTRPFKQENIVMLMDGYCASTCSLFATFMRHQAQIPTIAIGGRPSTAPMQGVGGIKGAQILSWSEIYSQSRAALALASSVNATSAQIAALKLMSNLPVNRSTSNGINVRNDITRDHLEDGKPGQFVVEEAECRLFWTQNMITDISNVWKSAANAAFKGGKCVNGGITKREASVENLSHGGHVIPRQPMSGGKLVLPRAVPLEEKDAMWSARFGRKVVQ
ncbi:peptidase s41 family protein [Halenospora varia]|nr:peptidase s41 family protein [Halenospora varia]